MSLFDILNRKEKLSRKQKIYRFYDKILGLFIILDIILLGYSCEKEKLWLFIIGLSLLFLLAIFAFFLERLEKKEIARVTNKSIEYYKKRRWAFIFQEYIAATACITFSIFLIKSRETKLDISNLYAICMGVFSLVPIIYVFILPEIKKTINSIKKNLNNILSQLASKKGNVNIKLLKEKQGEIYRLINLSNQANIELIVGIFFFVSSIMTFFSVEEPIQIYPTISIFYSLYEICVLIKLSISSYYYNQKEFEHKMKNQIRDIEKKEKSTQKKTLLKVYTKDGKVCGEISREKCLKAMFVNYYKKAHLIIRNKQKKYFAYEQIISYKKAQYCRKAICSCDELAKQDLKSSLCNIVKKDFGLTIKKNNFHLIKTSTNNEQHQIMEIYLVVENLKNNNIDYDIDLYSAAEFVSFNEFMKILIDNKDFSPNIIEEIREKLIKQD